jgi:hypothetical protein
MSSRPLRSKPLPPILPEIMARINTLPDKSYENIRKDFEAVVKYFKDDPDLITSFWLTHYEYDLTDYKHRYLLSKLFEKVGFKMPQVRALLDSIQDTLLLSQLGAVRYQVGNKTHYRTCVGINTNQDY